MPKTPAETMELLRAAQATLATAIEALEQGQPERAYFAVGGAGIELHGAYEALLLLTLGAPDA